MMTGSNFAGVLSMNPRKAFLAAALLILALFEARAFPQLTHLPAEHYNNSEVPVIINTPAASLDFVRREEMIPMRDGVKLFTVILIPQHKEHMPILMTRTPYNAYLWSSREPSTRLEDVLPSGDDVIAGAGYIRVFQDIRGKYRSEGEYVMNRPLRGPLNPTGVDHSTDTYDTIEWLLKNVPESNGRVGMIGTSYDGFLALMGLVNPHPALKAAVPVNPMVDTWMGDDWFHHGAFRQTMVDYLYDHEASNSSAKQLLNSFYDNYELYLGAGSAGELGRRLEMTHGGFWSQLLKHPSYDAFWQGQAVDKILAGQPLRVPTLYVHSLWDQEDIYGAIASYLATEPKDRDNTLNYLAIGPWSHGGSNGSGDALGPIKFDGDTALYFRRNILLPFLNENLQDNAHEPNIPPVMVYQTGTNVWQRYDSWPVSCETGCTQKAKPIYLRAGSKLDFQKPIPDESAYEEYISDPAKPVPYRLRPIRPTYGQDSSWSRWLVDDQRNFSDRPDVLSFESETLTQSVEINGQPIANLFASTSGTDSDFVVKIIDVYPDQYPSQPELGGYQLMISADIMRGRYRNDWEHPEAIPAGKIERYRWTLPAAAHTFLPGHRIMVQIQSSWFPLYDRNPQTYVDNIFWAKPADFQKATQRIYHSSTNASFIELPIVH
jgi:putative CocE/NonD family hydrolase